MTQVDPLIVDLYEPEGLKNWQAFAAAGAPWCGVVMKLSQGTYYNSGPWYAKSRRDFLLAASIQDSGSPRLGRRLFRGDYHFLDVFLSGVAQADYAWQTLREMAGKGSSPLHDGMIPLWLDVERGGQRSANITKGQVEETAFHFAERWAVLTGKPPILYGGELLRSLGIKTMLGCSHSVVALYGSSLHGNGETTQQFLERTGTDLDHLLAWQYCGDGHAQLAGYPTSAPGCGAIDISVLTLKGGLPMFVELCHNDADAISYAT